MTADFTIVLEIRQSSDQTSYHFEDSIPGVEDQDTAGDHQDQDTENDLEEQDPEDDLEGQDTEEEPTSLSPGDNSRTVATTSSRQFISDEDDRSAQSTSTGQRRLLPDDILESYHGEPYDREWMSKHNVSDDILQGWSSKYTFEQIVRRGAVKPGDKLRVKLTSFGETPHHHKEHDGIVGPHFFSLLDSMLTFVSRRSFPPYKEGGLEFPSASLHNAAPPTVSSTSAPARKLS